MLSAITFDENFRLTCGFLQKFENFIGFKEIKEKNFFFFFASGVRLSIPGSTPKYEKLDISL